MSKYESILVWIAIAFSIAGFIRQRTLHNGDSVPPLTESRSMSATVPVSVPLTESPLPSNPRSLQSVVGPVLESASGTYGIAVKNLKTGETYFQNEHRPFVSASLYKLWVMAEVYEKIHRGILTEDQVLSREIPELNKKFHIDPETAEKKEGTETHSVRDALDQMITFSDNYSALLLTEKIGLSSVAAFLKKYSLEESTVGLTGGLPMSTPADIVLFFEKLYKGELVDRENSDAMVGLLKRQTLNEGLPKYLPESLPVAHKTGEFDGFKHDAGIVYSEAGDYIIVVLSESENPQAAQEQIAQISRAAYAYFSTK